VIVDISGLDKADVLLVLYDNAHFSGLSFATQPLRRIFASMSQPGYREQAQSLIAAGTTNFNEVNLGAGFRPLKVNLAGNDFDSFAYDRDHGFDGYAAILVQALRTQSTKHQKKEDDEDYRQSYIP